MPRFNASFILLCILLSICGCHTTRKGSRVQASPGAIAQGAPFPVNLCNKGGLQDVPKGPGWTYDPRMGCTLICRDVDALKSDFVEQLRRHRIYGNPDLVAETDPAGAAIMRHYQERQAKLGLNARFLADITKDMVLDADSTQIEQLRVGDLMVFMTFGTPNRAGAFFSKRGMPHAVIVTKVDKKQNNVEVYQLEGGSGLSKTRFLHTQALWLRPRPEFFKEKDLKDVNAWSKLFARLPYDNLLIDDIQTFRTQLHDRLDQGMSQEQALAETWIASEKEKFPPFGRDGSFKYKQPSGQYCSEGVADVFTYLGFRQAGDTPIELVTAFNPDGKLPDWEIYRSALEGFNAHQGAALALYATFWNYFDFFDTVRKLGLITIPGLKDARDGSFASAIEANLKAVELDGGASDHIAKQLDQILLQLEKMPEQQKLVDQANDLKRKLEHAAGIMSGMRGQTINPSQAAYTLFKKTIAYGPHTFLENPKYFEFKGVFFNVAQTGHARYAADLAVEGPTPDEPRYINVSTTMYTLGSDKNLPGDRCVIAEADPEPRITIPEFLDPPFSEAD